jgi:hypothetical protein
MDPAPSLIREEPMASNMAAKRAAKANRRRAIVAEKRKAEMLADPLAERVRRAARAPIRHCLLTDGLFELGIGTMILARGFTADSLSVAIFLVDVHCLGIKDVVFRPVAGEEFEMLVGGSEIGQLSAPVDFSYARKLLRDVAVWAESIGFPPHRDFAVVERLFGDVNTDACDVAFQFGQDGKPFYTPGPSESPSQVRRRMEQLRARFGEEGFDVMAPL